MIEHNYRLNEEYRRRKEEQARRNRRVQEQLDETLPKPRKRRRNR